MSIGHGKDVHTKPSAIATSESFSFHGAATKITFTGFALLLSKLRSIRLRLKP
jgi:hypothetical protein